MALDKNGNKTTTAAETRDRERRDKIDRQRTIDRIARTKQWNKLSSAEKLQELDRRLGTGQGAKKQRKRLTESV